MAISRTKIAIVGAGNVGTALAHQIVIEKLCNTLVLIDLNKDKAWAEATDLSHSLGYSETKMEVYSGEYEDCKDADIVVLAVAAPYKVGMTRLDMLDKAGRIVSSIVPDVMKSGFNGLFIVITNPVDAMTYLVQKLSGLPTSRIIGTGTSLDSARLRYYLAKTMDVDARSVEAMCMGEHGDSQMIPWSQVTVGAKKFTDIMHDYPERIKDMDLSGISAGISKVAYKIMENKGATNYGIAAMAVLIIKAVLRDGNIVLPVSAMLNGEYGESGVYAGVPAIISSEGVKELVEYHLTEEEEKAFKASVAVLRDADKKLCVGLGL